MNRQRLRSTGWAAACFFLGLAAGRLLGRHVPGEPDTVTASRQIVHHASDAIVSADGNNIIVMANPAAAALFGTTVEDMMGSPLARFIDASTVDTTQFSTEDTPAWIRAGSSRAGRRATDYAVTGVRADGQRFPMEGSISRANEGAPFYTVIMRDVSERRRVQDKLSRSHDQLRQLSAALQTIREEERTHIARELHDDLGQILASLRMDLTLLQQADGTSTACA
jgi:PAS domain S-box-containing protein